MPDHHPPSAGIAAGNDLQVSTRDGGATEGESERGMNKLAIFWVGRRHNNVFVLPMILEMWVQAPVRCQCNVL